MARLFLSHSSAHNFAALALADWLAEEGWSDVFLDIDPERGIAAGQRWEKALHQAADRCEAVVFLVSRAWLGSGWCRKEYELGRRLSKQLFAVIVERGLSPRDLPEELTDTWQITDLASGGDHRMFAARLPGSDEERHVLVSRAGLKKAGHDPREFAWPPEGAKDPAPYVGLRALDADEAGLFFGRDADLVRSLDRLRALADSAAPRIVVILGASGAGKSSFLRAGLLPRLKRDEARFFCLPPIRPARNALDGDSGLIAALAAPEAARPPTVVIPVDQAEDLFSAQGAGETLLALLADLARADAPAVMLLFAIRSDAYDALERAKALEGMAQEALPLSPMPRHAARAVIEGSAARYAQSVGKLDLDPRLTQSLLDDLDRGGGRDALPLLAFTLERLWREYGGAGALTVAGYEAIGGLEGAIEAGVARAFARADVDPRIPRDVAAREALLRRGLIPWLGGVDPETRTPRRNVARAADIPDEARPLVDLLVEERLLGKGVDAQNVVTVEPTHEALLRRWGKLKGWLDEDFGLLAALEAARRAARDWDANARDAAWLAHRGQRLVEAGALDARPDLAAMLDARDREYLAACRAGEERQRAAAEQARAEREAAQARALADAQALAAANKRTARRTTLGATAALALALTAAGAAFYARRQEEAAQAQTQIAEAQSKAAQEQAARADRAVAKASDAVNTIAFRVSQKLRDRAGVPVDVMRALIEPALTLGGELVETGENSEALRRNYSVALSEAVLTFQSAGDLAAAASAAETSLKLARALAHDPADALAQRDLAVSLERVGDMEAAAGDRAGALALYQEGLDIDRAAAARDPSNAQAQRDLSVGLEKVGDMKAAAGDRAGALALYQEGLDIARAAAARDPSNAQAQRDLSVSLDKVGDMKAAAGDRAGALALYQESLAMRRAAAARDPSNAEAQRDLSYSLHKIANTKAKMSERGAALDAYREGFALVRKLLAQDPGSAEYRDDLIEFLFDLSKIDADPAPLLREALGVFTALEREGRLPFDKKDWREKIETALKAAARPK